MNVMDRFDTKVVPLTDGCWMWTASLTVHGGYGQFNDGSTMVRAHRWSYEQHVGPIPDGLDLDHLCRNRWCVNPDHLEPVSRGENLLRGYAARGVADSCAQGHPFDESNTFTRANGARGCRTCRNNASRASKARARAATAAAHQTGSNPA